MKFLAQEQLAHYRRQCQRLIHSPNVTIAVSSYICFIFILFYSIFWGEGGARAEGWDFLLVAAFDYDMV